MNQQDHDFGYETYARRDGDMSASNQRLYSKTQHPSREELAQYNRANYSSRKSKVSHGGSDNRRVVFASVAVAAVLLLVIPGIALAVSAKNAMDDAQTLMSQASAISSQIQSGDVEGTKRTVNDFASVAKRLDENVGSVLWAPLTLVPVYGDDVKDVRTIASAANTLSLQVLVPIAESLPSDGNITLFSEGAFNVSLLQTLLTPIGNASAMIQECEQQVNAMPDPHLAQLQQAVATLKNVMGPLGEISGYAGDLSRMLPDLLGVTAPRTYLIVACSQAELRSVGGFPGSTGLMTVTNGKIEIGNLEAPELPYHDDPVDWFPLTDEERLLFGDHAAANFYDASYIPDFPRVAEVMKFMWEKQNPVIDGIISIDPVFLQHMLGVIGSVTSSDGTVVDGNNASQILLHDVYVMFGDEISAETSEVTRTANMVQDDFFTEIASLTLDNFFSNFSDVGLIDAVGLFGEAVANKNFYMWMVNPEEEELLKRMDAACAVSVDEAEPELGVYLSTAVATKQDWYLGCETVVDDPVRNGDGTTSYNVTTRVFNRMHPDEAGTLPPIMTNTDGYVGSKIRSLGDMIVDVYLFAPQGGSITNMTTIGAFAPGDIFADVGTRGMCPGPDPISQTSYNGREVWYGITMIEPQQETVISYTVTTSSLATAPLAVDSTPLAQAVG